MLLDLRSSQSTSPRPPAEFICSSFQLIILFNAINSEVNKLYRLLLIILYYVTVLIDVGKNGVCHSDITLLPFRRLDYCLKVSGEIKGDIHQRDTRIGISRRPIVALANESYSLL